MYENTFGYSEKLPENIRIDFMWLCQDVASLQSKWNFYQELFSEEQNTEILSEVAFWSFVIIEESLRNDMTMAIGRLSDKPKIKSDENLSFERLIEKCTDISGLSILFDEFKDACKPIKKLRNKRIAHTDVNSKLQPQEYPIAGIGRNRIDLILDLASRMLGSIIGHYASVDLNFHTITTSGGKTLILRLKEWKDWSEKTDTIH